MISGAAPGVTSAEADVLGAQQPTSLRWRLSARLTLGTALLLSVAGLAPAADRSSPGHGATPSQGQRAMWITIGGKHRFAMALEDNTTARAFVQLLPLSLDMPDLNDNEKHVRLPRSLPTNAARPRTIRTGDVMLYGNDTLVVFYKTFPSNYSYTRIGRITSVEGLVEALRTGTQRVEFAER